MLERSHATAHCGAQRNPSSISLQLPQYLEGCLTDGMLLHGILQNSWPESVCGILSPPLSLPWHFWNHSMHCRSGFDVGPRDVKSSHQVKGHLGPGSSLCHVSLWDDITSFVFFSAHKRLILGFVLIFPTRFFINHIASFLVAFLLLCPAPSKSF